MFTENQTLKTAGLDMNCDPTVEIVKFIRYLTKPKNLTTYKGDPYIQDCVVLCDGVRIILDSSELWA